VVTGLTLAVIQGALLPLFGWFVPEAIFAMMYTDREKMWDESLFWIIAMLVISIYAGINMYFYKFAFGTVG